MALMQPRRTYTFFCKTVAEFQATLRHAHWIKKYHPRPDGLRYNISSNAQEATITIKVDNP